MSTIRVASKTFHRSPPVYLASACLIGVSVFYIPYRVPVTPSISISYVVGFNNHAAVVAFLLGIALFAFVAQGELGGLEQEDRSLPISALVVSLVVIFLCCVVAARGAIYTPGAQEAFYNLNRQQLLSAGLAPYRQFEYLYGPLLLYPGTWFARILHLSQPAAYYTWWIIQWLLGTLFSWTVIRALDVNLKYRLPLFVFLFLMQFAALSLHGSNYTPFRSYAAAFFVAISCFIWRRSRSVWKTNVAAILCVGLALAISMDQATGAAAGMSVYLFLLALSSRSRNAWAALAVYLCCVVLLFIAASRLGWFISLRSFASGGLCFPLLPTVGTCLILFLYVVAGIFLYRSLKTRNLDSIAVPLVVAGLAMLPSALGRCDLGHLLSATPALVVGVAVISAMPAIRRWWFPLFILFVVLVPTAVQLKNRRFMHRIADRFSSTGKDAAAHALAAPSAAFQSVPKKAASIPYIPLDALPCDRTYYSLSVRPITIANKCLDTGYYLAMQVVTTEESIHLVVDEMRRHIAQPLLLYAAPLEDQLSVNSNFDKDPENLYALEGAFAVPRAKHVPVTFAPIVDYIQSHYTPGPLVDKGLLRIWYPIVSPAP